MMFWRMRVGEQPASQKERAPQQSVGVIRGRNLPSCSSASTDTGAHSRRVGERARWTGGEGCAGNRGDFSRLCTHADPSLAEGWQRTSASAGFEAAQWQGVLSSFSLILHGRCSRCLRLSLQVETPLAGTLPCGAA